MCSKHLPSARMHVVSTARHWWMDASIERPNV